MCQNFDELDYSVFIDDTEKVLQDDIEKIERNKPFPINRNETIGKCVMKFPRRFFNRLVIEPANEYKDYSTQCSKRIKTKDVIIKHTQRDGQFQLFYSIFMGHDSKEPLFPLLSSVVKNDSNEIDFDYSLVDKILACGDIHLLDLQEYFYIEEPKLLILANKDLPLWLTFLRSKIETILVTEEIMEKNAPSYIKGLVKKSPDDKIENLSEVMETLGLYIKDTNILICPKRIRTVANRMGYDPNIMFCIVYLHELAHAAMDPKIDAKEELNQDYEYCIDKVSNKYEFDTPSNYMEESLANMIMLKYMNNYSQIEGKRVIYNVAEEFVEQQAAMYNYGLEQFKIDVDWTKWRNYKMEHEESEAQLRDWYNKCFIAGHKEDYSKEMFDEIMGSYQD